MKRDHLSLDLRALGALGLLTLGSMPACSCEDQVGKLHAAIKVDPAALDFGSVAVGGNKDLELTLQNTGLIVLTVSDFQADAPFVVTAKSSTVGTGSSIKVTVSFRPTALGPAMGMLSFASTDEKAPMLTVPLSGVGIAAAVKVDPPVIDFGEVLWNAATTPEMKTVTVSNPGTDNFDLTSLVLTDTASHAFSMDPMGAKKTYPPMASGPFSVTLTPNARGMLSSSVKIQTTASAAPEITVPVTASVVGPEMQICANLDGQMEGCTTGGNHPKLAFNEQINATGHGTVRVLNVGNRDLTISQILANGQAAEYAFSPMIGTTQVTIAPGMSSSWGVSYTPVDYTLDIVTLTFVSDSAPPGASSIRLEGRVLAPGIDVRPRTATFHLSGNVYTGQTHVGIFNCGTAPLILGTISPPAAGTISIQNVPANNTMVAPDPNCNSNPATVGFDVVFSTMTDGQYSAMVDVPSNDPINPHLTVTVQGTKSP